MRLFFSFLVLCLSLSTGYAQTEGWVKVTLNNGAEVSFPSKPDPITASNGSPGYRLRLADSTATLVALAGDLSKTGIDAATYEEAVKTEEFWKNFATGVLNSMKNTSIVSQQKIEVDGRPGLLLEMERSDGTRKDRLYQLTFIKDLTSYSAVFNNRNGRGDLSVKDAFLKSLRIL